MVIYKSDPNKTTLIEQNRAYRERKTALDAAVVERDLAEYPDVAKQYKLSGEVETDWLDSEAAALEAYNEAVAKHNQQYKRESNHYAFLEQVYGGGCCHETLWDGTHQIPVAQPISRSRHGVSGGTLCEGDWTRSIVMKSATKNKAEVTIEVHNVGQAFGCRSVIKRGSKTLWESRCFPYGFRAAAHTAAEDKARSENWAVAHDSQSRF